MSAASNNNAGRLSSTSSGATTRVGVRGSNNNTNKTNNQTIRQTTRHTVKPSPSSSRQHPDKGRRDFDFVQINTNKARQATNDLVVYLTTKHNPIVLVQEPYVKTNNTIPTPSADLLIESPRRGVPLLWAQREYTYI